jgi:RNA polymerase sigma-70 factor, ECF subfamily
MANGGMSGMRGVQSIEGERDNGSASDEAMLVTAAQADPAAFDALYRRYLTRVYHYMRAHPANDDDAADLAQQVFLQALSALPEYRPRAPFAAWLFRIARHAVIDAHRRRRGAITLDALPDTLLATAAQDLEAAALRREALERLGVFVAELDPHKRELLALRFAAQLSSSEIAAVVGKRPEAVKKLLTRTLHALRERCEGALL